jgi:hypothetical protein
MAQVVTASYETREEAEHATERLIAAGLMRQEISMLAPEENGGSFNFAIEPKKRTLAGVGGGMLVGLLLGAVCGAVLALVPLDLPALDQVPFDPVALGPILSALIGAGAGAAVGFLFGALVGALRTENEAVVRGAADVHQPGYVLVGVAVPREMMRSAVHVLSTAGAHRIQRS